VDACIAGVPGAVVDGLTSDEGDSESPLGPIENLGPCFGSAETAPICSEAGAEVGALCGEVDLCGVMTSGMGRGSWGWLLKNGLLSRLFVAAGVSGGECTAVVGGDGLGEGSFEPACICLLLGVATPEFVPDGTFEQKLALTS
jgi:hypothetical protein